MYAIVEISGKQYKVSEGDIVFVDRLEKDEAAEVIFDKVLLVADGDKVTVGDGSIKGATVKATVIGHGKDKKVIVFKYKAKKNYRKTSGHRQPYTKIQIEKISLKAEKIEKKADEKVEEKVETKKPETKKTTTTEKKTATTEKKATTAVKKTTTKKEEK